MEIKGNNSDNKFIYWEKTTLGAVIDKFVGGGTPRRVINEYWGGKIPWVTVKDLTDFNPQETQEYITKQGLLNSSSKLIPKGNLIISTRMALGKAVLYNMDVSINQDLKALFPNKDIKVLFLFYWFQFHKNEILELGNGSTVKGISLIDLKKVKLLKPPIKEQTAIANVLSDTDALIESVEKLIEKKKQIKQGAMQELLTGKKRLPGFAPPNPQYKKTEVGFIPEDWEVHKLGAISRINMGQSPSSISYNADENGLPLIQGKADFADRKAIKRIYTTQITKTCIPNDILMSVRAPVGSIVKTDFKACLGRGVCSISYPNDYLYYYLIYIEKSWNKLSTGSTFDSINSSQLSNINTPLPSTIEEQTAIANLLSDMDKEIEELEKKLDKYKMIKQGMMQKLLTGQIRLIENYG